MVRSALTLAVGLVLASGCDPEEPDDDVSGDDDTTSEPSELDIESIPHNGLACLVHWTTDVPATTELTATAGDGEPLQYLDDKPVDEHEVLVLGLWEQARFELSAVSHDEQGEVVFRGQGAFETSALSFPMPELTVVAHDPEKMHKGWTLTSFLVEPDLDNRAVVAVDPEGRVRWYHAFESQGAMAAVDTTLAEPGGHVLVGPLPAEGQRALEVTAAGHVVWEGPEQPAVGVDGYMHHTLRKQADGDYLALFYSYSEGHTLDVIQKFDPDGEVTWRWDSGALMSELETTLWANAVQMDDDAVYLNSRLHSRLYRIDPTDGEVVWTLGEEGEFAFEGEHEEPWFSGAHATSVLPDGHVLMYDNGAGTRGYSRAVEYAIDEDARTARIAWEYPGELADDHWYTSIWGDVDRLDNGNTLITAGSMVDTDTPSRIFEVTPDGEVVWRIDLAGPTEDARAGVYTAERIPPLVAHAP